MTLKKATQQRLGEVVGGPPGGVCHWQTREEEMGQSKDLLFEAVCGACGIDWHEVTRPMRGALNRAVSDLREVGATTEQIGARAEVYQAKWPGISITPSALAKNWALLAPRRQNGSSEPKGWAGIRAYKNRRGDDGESGNGGPGAVVRRLPASGDARANCRVVGEQADEEGR